MANRGFMLQLDGSEHRWNGKDIWTKISIIDDADSKVLFSRFFKSETTFGCMYVLRRVIEDYGCQNSYLQIEPDGHWAARRGRIFHSLFVRVKA